MFKNNWIQHTVQRGQCLHCKRAYPGEGAVYAKGAAILQCVPVKYEPCKGDLNG